MLIFAGHARIRVVERYAQTLDLLDEVYQRKREPEIYGVRATITRKDIVAMILSLCDILIPLCRLSYSSKTVQSTTHKWP